MPNSTITEAPFVEDLPSLVVGHSASGLSDGLQLNCSASSINHRVRQQYTDIETYCNQLGERSGAAPQDFVVGFMTTHELYLALQPMFGTLQRFGFLWLAEDAVSATNQEMSGQLFVPKLSFYPGAKPGQALKQTVEFKIFGAVEFADNPAAADTTHPV